MTAVIFFEGQRFAGSCIDIHEINIGADLAIRSIRPHLPVFWQIFSRRAWPKFIEVKRHAEWQRFSSLDDVAEAIAPVNSRFVDLAKENPIPVAEMLSHLSFVGCELGWLAELSAEPDAFVHLGCRPTGIATENGGFVADFAIDTRPDGTGMLCVVDRFTWNLSDFRFRRTRLGEARYRGPAIGAPRGEDTAE